MYSKSISYITIYYHKVFWCKNLFFFVFNLIISLKIASFHSSVEASDSACYENATIWLEALDNIRFAIETVALPSVGILGIMGNTLIIITLIKLTKSKKENKNQTNFDRLLIFLSVADSLVLVMHIIDAIIQAQYGPEPIWYQVINLHCCINSKYFRLILRI